jgi:hypothetical protein
VALGLSYFRFCKSEPELYKFMFSHMPYLKDENSTAESKKAFEFLLNATQGDKQRAHFLWSMVHGLCSLLLADLLSDLKIEDSYIEKKVVAILNYHQMK